ncbi:hypothetical protein KIN20_027537 [Parelaphostrongylus tenuis]|uniref:Uncharacterized protein n=1 Tax=Parelaphostrongylus tenuis TaxID=148309 RepID=A0AAD5QZI0_PARTN|nr:hypothetical protein KIN20_027537 [Parelaphostrongylus tenuis]
MLDMGKSEAEKLETSQSTKSTNEVPLTRYCGSWKTLPSEDLHLCGVPPKRFDLITDENKDHNANKRIDSFEEDAKKERIATNIEHCAKPIERRMRLTESESIMVCTVLSLAGIILSMT